jgi:hypothetical protein
MNLVTAVKEHPVLGNLYRRLTSAAEIVPYYLVREYIVEESGLGLQPKLDPLEVRFLEPAEIRAISQSPEVKESEDTLLKRLDNGCMCLGIRHKGHIVAYSWCNLKKCDYEGRLEFDLKDDEAYLFDARTFQAYRGKNLAPYLRRQLYKNLAEMGRTKFFSTTSTFNTSAMKFKEKLGAEPFRLYLYIHLLGVFRRSFLLRKYEAPDR